MKIVARQPSPGTFLLEFFPERVQMASPYVKLAYAQLFGKEEWVATVSCSSLRAMNSAAALEFGASVRAAAMTAFDLTNGKVTVAQLLKLWGPLPVPQAATP
jgi:hypothetical protein